MLINYLELFIYKLALLVMRCYALYYDNYWILVGLSLLGLATVAAAAVRYYNNYPCYSNQRD